MQLLTVRKWLGPSREGDRSIERRVRLTGFVTRLELGEALNRLSLHERAYRREYPSMACEFELIGVCGIQDLTPGQIEAGRLTVIEDLDV